MSIWTFLGSAGKGNDDFELLESVPMLEGIIGTHESCEVRLRDPMLTPRHARVLKQDGAWYVGGIAIASPTFVNGVSTIPGQAMRLSLGDVVQLGSSRFLFGGEGPPRQGVDANDPKAVLVFGDRLAELGSPLGLRILEGHAPSAEWLPGCTELSQGLVKAHWSSGLLQALTVRECTVSQLKTILADEASVALERLTIHLATCDTRSEEEGARALLRVVAETRPPRLQKLELGWLHEPLSSARAGRDWQSLVRRVPLQGTLEQTYRLAGGKRFTMLRSGTGWPAVGVTSALVESQIFRGDRGEDDELVHQNISFLNAKPRHAASVSVRRKFKFELRVNGLSGAASRRLVHGDLVEGPDFAFRFEEE